ncbi:MAG: Arginine-tRNA ligase [candidate division Kazan bacterium GW2011_GWC1_52_13]|nr:MAG: Arginine-tRNA ligase [candidate division Kazan bacterium GW2011_GWC1_52_13]
MADFKKILQEEVKKAVLDIYQVNLEPNIEHPGQSGHGDYSSNVALLLAKDLKLPPVKIAEEVSQMIKKRKLSVLRSLEVVAPGFLNFWLSDDVLIQEVAEILKSKDKYGSSSSGKGRKLVVEYSSPNIAKRFGVGHLRSTVIGQALFNLYSFLGYQTIGDNHLGDWGTQFGILLFQITDKKLPLKKLTIEKLEELYVEFHENSADQPQMMEEARSWFKKLEDRDQEARRIWQAVVKLSVAEFDRIYDILGIKIDHSYGESSYEEEMKEVIKEVRNKGLSRKSQGAEIVEFPNIPPALLLKSDGATTYFTRDLATIRFRLGEWGPQKIIYEVGADQKLHFQQVFAAAKMLGWDKNREFVHVAHGLIRFPEGKMSTRRGKTIKLEDILTEAVKRAKVVVAKSANSKGLSPKQKEANRYYL